MFGNFLSSPQLCSTLAPTFLTRTNVIRYVGYFNPRLDGEWALLDFFWKVQRMRGIKAAGDARGYGQLLPSGDCELLFHQSVITWMRISATLPGRIQGCWCLRQGAAPRAAEVTAEEIRDIEDVTHRELLLTETDKFAEARHEAPAGFYTEGRREKRHGSGPMVKFCSSLSS